MTGETIRSRDTLNEDVPKLRSRELYKRNTVLCKGRGEMSYLEAPEQFGPKVLETDEYYNGIINVRVGSSKALRESAKNKTNIASQHSIESVLYAHPDPA